jgi:hypothetical protein
MIATLEQADQGMAARRIAIMVGTGPGELLQAEVGEKMGPLMVCLFSGTSHSNFGEYDGGMSPQAVKRRFFEILGYQLGLSGQPKMIGDLAAAYGHPETGLSSQKNNSGCLAVIFLCVGIGGLGIFGVTEILRTFA